jgi:hypothetical protein
MTPEISSPGENPRRAAEAAMREALERAFDYRGDVTITRRDGTRIEGYVFDRRAGATMADSAVRVLVRSGGEKVTIRYVDIAALVFTGRDAAAGPRRTAGGEA